MKEAGIQSVKGIVLEVEYPVKTERSVRSVFVT